MLLDYLMECFQNDASTKCGWPGVSREIAGWIPGRRGLSCSSMGATGVKRLGLAAAIWTAMAAPVPADFPAAVEAYDQGDYATTFAESKPLAERGDADAQYMLGYLYARGQGVRRDLVRAYLWFTLAAWQGDAFAADAVIALARRMKREDIATAETLARSWTSAPE